MLLWLRIASTTLMVSRWLMETCMWSIPTTRVARTSVIIFRKTEWRTGRCIEPIGMALFGKVWILHLYRYSSPSILQPSILRPPLIIRPLALVPKGNQFSALNDLYFKTTCNIRPHLLGPMGGLKIEGTLYKYNTGIGLYRNLIQCRNTIKSGTLPAKKLWPC